MTTLTMNWDSSGLPATSVLDMFHALGSDATALGFVRDAWQLHLRDVVNDQTSLVSLGAGGDVPTELSVNEPGTLSGQPSPPNSTYLVNKNPDGGRRGRWFLPGLAEDDTFGNGTISATRRNAVTAACNDFLAELVGSAVQLRIARNDGSFSNINSFTCQELIGVQRKRLGR